MRRIIPALLLLFSVGAYADKPVAPEEISGATNLSAEQVVELILNTPDLVIIDARKENEYAKGHIEGAISLLNTELDEEKLSIHVKDKQTPVLFYCNGIRCKRSTDATTKALSWGYSRVYWFRGGWVEWQQKKLPEAR